MPLVLFVCTGNLCRSPMATGLARAALDPGNGIEFASAGTRAWEGSSPTADAVAVCAEVGVDIAGHRSRPVTADLLRAADHVYGMDLGHLAEMRAVAPEVADRIQLLDPVEIADPYGRPRATYRHARDRIAAAIAVHAPDWVS